jgi:hypothetical protein
MKLYETLARDSDVGKMDISTEASFVLMREILYILNVIPYESWWLRRPLRAVKRCAVQTPGDEVVAAVSNNAKCAG